MAASIKESINYSDYKCNYPSDPNVFNINTVVEPIKLNVEGHSFHENNHIFSYYISYHGDVIQSFNVLTNGDGQGIKQIIIKIGGICVYNKEYLKNTNNKKVIPFVFGIPLVSLCYDSVKLYVITSNSECLVTADYLFLKKPNTDFLVKNELNFDGTVIKHGIWDPSEIFNDPFVSFVNKSTSNYNCPYPCKLTDIIAPEIQELCIMGYNKNQFKFSFSGENGDILKDITIEKESNTTSYQFEISIGGTKQYTSDVFYDKKRTFTPFEYGIPLFALRYQVIEIKIKCNWEIFESKPEIQMYANYFLMKDNTYKNELLKNGFTLDTKIRIRNGVFGDLTL